MFIALWAADGEGCYKLQLLRLCQGMLLHFLKLWAKLSTVLMLC